MGLTGNIGSGKSTILAYFRQFAQVLVLDADKLAHQAMQPGGPAFQPIVEAFGPQIVAEDGTIDRSVLGQMVFGDAHQLRVLESISHPSVYRLARESIEDAGRDGKQFVIMEAIKLLDGGRTVDLCDEIWVVTIDKESQFSRLREQRGMGRDGLARRLKAQSTQEEKIARADRIIDNSGSLADLHHQLAQIWKEIQSN